MYSSRKGSIDLISHISFIAAGILGDFQTEEQQQEVVVMVLSVGPFAVYAIVLVRPLHEAEWLLEVLWEQVGEQLLEERVPSLELQQVSLD